MVQKHLPCLMLRILIIVFVTFSSISVALAANSRTDGKAITLSENLDVDPASGTASISIPIEVPQGRAGLQPNLTILYNSSGSNGMLGMGWSLELGSIQRSLKQGNLKYNNSDKFIFGQGGAQQDLVDISGNGTEFRSEIEADFMKMQFNGTSWTFTDKKGTKYYFGSSSHSRVADPTDAAKVFKWHLDRVEDISGNYMTVSYISDSGYLYPSEIKYTGNQTQNLLPYASVTFQYLVKSSSADMSVFYAAGFKMLQRQQLKSIQVLVNNEMMRKYVTNYTTDSITGKSLLRNVQLYGKDGVSTLPATIMTYSKASFTTDPSIAFSSLPGSLGNARSRMMDMNNDGLPDLIDMSTAGNWKVYFNTSKAGPVGFGPATTVVNSPSFIGDSPDARFVDLNSDGLLDVVLGDVVKNYQVWINNGRNGFEAAKTLVNSPSIKISTNSVEFFDMNSDGFPDMIQSQQMFFDHVVNGYWKFFVNDGTGSFLPETDVVNSTPSALKEWDAMRLLDINGDGLTDIIRFDVGLKYLVWLNNGVDGFQQPYKSSEALNESPFERDTQFADFNGDGLSDLLVGRIKNGEKYRLYYNNGKGAFNASVNVVNAPDIALDDPKVKVVDFNGDNLPDIVVGGSPYKVYINNGNDGFFPAINLGNYPSVGLENPNVVLVDINGDGMLDIVRGEVSNYQIWANTVNARQAKANSLIDVDNSVGGHMELQYQNLPIKGWGGTQYGVVNSRILFNTVKNISRRASLTGEVYVASYDYQGGLWDNRDREFRGFKTVKMIDPDGNYSVTEYAQDDIYKGRPLSQASYDSQDRLFGKSVNTWSNQVLYPNVNFPFLKQTDSYIYDGNATGRRTQSQFFYAESPQYGNLTKSINFGEVNLTTGADIGTDKSTVEVVYNNNPSKWILGLPKVSTVKNSSGVIFSKATFYYDSNTDYNALSTKGFLTKKTDWAGDAPGTVHPFTKYSYDAIGNVLSLEDSKGSKTTTVYDTTYHLFPLQTTNALGHKVVSEYYGINGVALSSSDGTFGLWGQVKSTTDSNQQKGLQIYDTFGRLSKVVSPFDTIAMPTKSYEYVYHSSQLKVISHQRVKSGQAETIDNVQFYDGLGRLVQSKSKSEIAGKFIVNGQTEYNSRGLPVKKYVSYLTSTPLTDLGPADTTQPYTLIAYDAMGRVLRTTAPDGSYSNVVYDDWTSTSYDENGHMQKSYADAFGRLIKKEEYFGQDGRHTLYPAATYTLYATTLYTYDPKGNLIKTQDAKGNITTIVYDTLGRKIQMTDPDMGTWKYGYDVEGNLIWQQDAKGQKINFTYDQMNRLKSKTDLGVLTVNYTYDDVNAQNSKGRLTNAAYGGGNTSFKYDELGRELESIKVLGSTNYSVSRNYDALDRLVNLQYPDGTKLSYQYNDMGLVESVSEASVDTTPTPPLPAPAPIAMTAPFTQIKFNENTAAQVITDSGTGAKHGVAHFYPVQLTTLGKINRTYQLNTPQNFDQFIEMNSFAQAVKNDSQGSFAFWIKRNANGVGTVYSAGPTIAPGSAFQIYVTNNGTLLVTLFGVVNNDYAMKFRYFFPQASTGDIWEHFAITQDGTGVKVYRNGTLLTNGYTDPYFTEYQPTAWFKDVTAIGDDQISSAYIGANIQSMTPRNTFPGQIDDFRYYKKGLSVQEIAALYNNGNGTEELTPFLSPASAPLTPSPAPSVMSAPYAQFKLNDNVNSSAVVDSGAGTHSGNATFMTTSLSIAGKVNKTFNLNETYDLNQYINVSSFAQSVKNDSQGSFAFWIKRSPSTAGMVYSSGSTTTLGSAFQIMVGYDGSLMVNLSALSNGRSLGLFRHTYDNVVPPDVWQHFVIYQDGTGVKVYLNGILIEGYSVPFYTTNPTAWFKDVTAFGSDQISTGMIGANVRLSGATNFLGGQIDDFRYYQKVLTTDEIKALYNNGAGSEELTPNLSDNAVPPTSSTFVKNVDYNAVGQMTKVEFGNGVVTTYTYSPTMLRLMNIKTVNIGGTILQDFTYAYDGTGNITSITDAVNTATQTFKYDALNRLTQAIGVSYGTKNYSYDQIGNIISKDGLTYTYSKVSAGPHAVTSLSDGTIITYDLNGNMATKSKAGEVMQYLYDSENRLTQVIKNTTLIAEYLYDGDGGRVQKTSYLTTVQQTAGGLSYGAVFGTPQIRSTPVISKYIGELYEETDNVGTNFIFLGSQRIAALDSASRTPVYYHGDHLGSTNVMSDSSGSVAELLEYDPYGKIQRHDALNGSTRLAKQQFTGKKLDDETGLIYFGARYYDPSLGRFITPDTIVQNPSDPQTLNRYSYCSNNPINKIDLDGHKWSWKKFWKKWGDFVSPLGRAIVTGDWKHFALFTLTLVSTVLAPNPWLFTAGGLSLLSQSTANIGDNASREISRALGYASTAAAVIGTGVEFEKSFNSWNERNQIIKDYETNLIDNRKEALGQGVFDTTEFYSREVQATGNILKHDALKSSVFKNGVWEMGPEGRLIQTSNTVSDLSRWSTHQATAYAISSGAKPLTIQVNSGMLSKSAGLFDRTFAGKVNYIASSYNSNYAINSVLYGAGANIKSPLGYGGFRAPGFPTISPYLYKNK